MFRPKLLDVLRAYDRATFLADLAAGVTVGVVALPLAIGFGIASGVTPGQGLWTAIIAGFLISALGGSLVQVGGPTGASVPILAGIVAVYGYGGLAVATLMSPLDAPGSLSNMALNDIIAAAIFALTYALISGGD